TVSFNGAVKSVAMGSASRGPLLVYSVVGGQPFFSPAFALLDTDTMKWLHRDIKLDPVIAILFRNSAELRAAANGTCFGLWASQMSPNGLATFVLADGDVKTYYQFTSSGHVVPGPDGK